jgi:hypothetical protein
VLEEEPSAVVLATPLAAGEAVAAPDSTEVPVATGEAAGDTLSVGVAPAVGGAVAEALGGRDTDADAVPLAGGDSRLEEEGEELAARVGEPLRLKPTENVSELRALPLRAPEPDAEKVSTGGLVAACVASEVADADAEGLAEGQPLDERVATLERDGEAQWDGKRLPAPLRLAEPQPLSVLEALDDAVSLGLGRGEPLPLAEAVEQGEGGGDREGESRADGERLPAAPAVGVGSAGEAEGDRESEGGPEAVGEAEGEGVTRAALAVGAPFVRVPTREPVAFALAVPDANTERVVEPAPLREVLTQMVPVASAGVPLCEDDASHDAEGEPLTPALPEGDPDAKGELESEGECEGDSEKDAVPVGASVAAAERLNVGEVVPLPRDVALPPAPDDSEGEGVMGRVASCEALPQGEREGVLVLLVKVEPEVEAIAGTVAVTEGGDDLLLEGEPVSLSL